MKKTLLRMVCLMLAMATLLSGAAVAEAPADDGAMRLELTSLEVSRLMGNGINLGNTMEACDGNLGNTGNSPLTYEVSWGQPVTTQEMITGMKEMGFDTLRIPVAWMTNATHLGQTGDYIIDQAYLDRVKEIVDYARNADMYVIINDHWDGGWYGMFGSESAETRQLAMDAYIGMWTQIAVHFAEYSDYVIFESANEELGARFDENSALYCDDSVKSYLSDDERYALCNEVNQAFVDSVRATGGNNENRFLLIAGYGTNVDQTCDARFKMPVDTAKDKLLLSVHCYSPTTYCLANSAASATPWGLKSHYAALEEELGKMAKFTKQGVGVVIGEYGALPQADGIKENTLAYHTLFLDLCTYYDLTNCLWDCSGLYLRRDLKPADEDIAAMYRSKNAASEVGKDYADLQAAARAAIDEAAAAAPDTFNKDAFVVTDDNSIAWIMWNDGGYAISYSVGDTYNPDSKTPGLKVTDAEITGPGNYTVGLDFTETAQGYSASIAFAALGIANGESLYPGYVIDIKDVQINGQKYNLKGRAYTTSDDGRCTRVNLFNEWVPTPNFSTARMHFGNTAGITAMPINRNDAPIAEIKTIYITFEYGPQKK